MITHGDFMLTLFSFALFFVSHFSCLCAIYSTISYFPYYVHKMLVSFYDFHLYKASNVSFQSCFPFYKITNIYFFCSQGAKETHNQRISIYYILDNS